MSRSPSQSIRQLKARLQPKNFVDAMSPSVAGLHGGLSSRFPPGWHKEPIVWGVGISLVFHLLLMLIKFVPPAPLMIRALDSQLEVILLNASTDNKPLKPDVLAQVNMEGGGDRESGRAKSPLPAQDKIVAGQDLKTETKRVQELEQAQQQLLALMQKQAASNPELAKPDPNQNRATDANDSQSAISMLQAQIAKDLDAYSKRPKRLTFGVNALGVTFARYVDDWAEQIEQIGTERYPPEARGKFYDTLIVTVEIRRDGSVASLVINKPSKHAVLNQAVKRIVYAGQPYERFTSDMSKQGDILQIVRTWTFTNEGLETEAVNPEALRPAN